MKEIGFIGLGNMGAPMASNLVHAGFDVIVYDKNTDALNSFTSMVPSAKTASSVSELASLSDTIITMLPNPEIVRDICLGESGIIESVRPGTCLIEMST